MRVRGGGGWSGGVVRISVQSLEAGVGQFHRVTSKLIKEKRVFQRTYNIHE